MPIYLQNRTKTKTIQHCFRHFVEVQQYFYQYHHGCRHSFCYKNRILAAIGYSSPIQRRKLKCTHIYIQANGSKPFAVHKINLRYIIYKAAMLVHSQNTKYSEKLTMLKIQLYCVISTLWCHENVLLKCQWQYIDNF